MSNKVITHDGVVEEVRDHRVVVKFSSNPACGDCHAKGLCSIPGNNEQNLEIPVTGIRFSSGEKVKIILSREHGFKAVFLAYILPFLFVLLFLLVLNCLTHNEALSGVLSITILVPYYYILWKFRKKLAKQFNFRITKI